MQKQVNIFTTQIEQFGYFIFDLSISNTKFVKIEVIGSAMTVNFENLS